MKFEKMKNKQHIMNCLTSVKSLVQKNPVRDLILVKNEYSRDIGRAVRYATAYFVLTGLSGQLGLHFSTNILFLTEHGNNVKIFLNSKSLNNKYNDRVKAHQF